MDKVVKLLDHHSFQFISKDVWFELVKNWNPGALETSLGTKSFEYHLAVCTLLYGYPWAEIVKDGKTL